MSVQNIMEDVSKDVLHKEPGTDANVTKDSHWIRMAIPAEVRQSPDSNISL